MIVLSSVEPVPFSKAAASLSQFTHVPDIHEHIARTTVDKDGAMKLQLQHPVHGGWYAWANDTPRLQDPLGDAELPLAIRIDRDDAQILNYRPDRRLVVARTLDGRRVVTKGYRVGKHKHALRGYSEAQRLVDGSGFHVPEVLSWDDASAAINLSYLDGESFSDEERDEHHFFEVGTRLLQLQSATPTVQLPSYGPSGEITLLDGLATRVQKVSGTLPEGWLDAFLQWAHIAIELPQVKKQPCHRDFYDKQLLLSESGIGLVDFDNLCMADPCLDIGNFLAHVSLRRLQHQPNRGEGAQLKTTTAFLDGLGRQAEPFFWLRLRFYEASSFLRLALLYSLRPRWNAICEPCIGLAVRCTEDARREIQ